MDALDKLIKAVEADCANWLGWEEREAVLPGILWKHARGADRGSLDAALALHEALVPGWDWEVCNDMGDQTALVWPNGKSAKAVDGHMEFVHRPTPARAWLLAILRAYRSIHASNGEVG